MHAVHSGSTSSCGGFVNGFHLPIRNAHRNQKITEVAGIFGSGGGTFLVDRLGAIMF